MLGTGARYAEYGITGGFFLFTTALILGLFFPAALIYGADGLGSLFSAIIGKIPPLAQPAIQSLLVALALLSVFIVGLVLEIIGSLLVFREALTFRQHLIAKEWIAKFIQVELPDYEEDYILFLEMTDPQKQKEDAIKQKEEFRKLRFKPWALYSSQWKAIVEGSRRVRLIQQRFRRLEFNLMAKVLTSGAKTEMLTDQISICRMSRGIATALFAASMSFALGNVALSFRLLDYMKPEELALTRGAYSRLAYILFSLVYAG